MASQAAEQIIAGVVLSERLAVTMYGAIHRAQFAGQRNLRGLVVDPKMLAETSFRLALTSGPGIDAAIALAHDHIVPTVAVEAGGPDVVVVTRGVGRFVSVQDLIAMARANRGQGGRLSLPIAAAIAKSVVEALAAAHKANVVHGAVHPRSVLLDTDGAVRLGDFVVGRALTTAVAQGADSSLWRGLAGFLAPELVVGEDPSPASDVFAVGAMLFTMLSGEVPPGTLNVTPAVERLVQRALDTDTERRYKSANDLLENLLEAFEDDRWELADGREIVQAAGLSLSDTNIDDATEDLLASLGNSAVQVTPTRPSMDFRAEVVSARQSKTGANRLDALLADLDDPSDPSGVTRVEETPFKRDPISELIHLDPRKREAIVQAKARVPSLDDVDDETPLPPPSRGSDADLAPARPNTRDELAAMDALAGLDAPVRRVSTAAEQATAAAQRLEQAANRAEAAAVRVETGTESTRRSSEKRPAVRPVIIEPMEELPPVRLKSRALGIISLLVVVAGAVGFYIIYQRQQDASAEQEARHKQAQLDADEKTKHAIDALADAGALAVTSTPSEAGVWLRLGRTPVDSMQLSEAASHEFAAVLDGHELGEAQVTDSNWSGDKAARKATISITLKPLKPDAKTHKLPPSELPNQPALGPQKYTSDGKGPIHIESQPTDAEAYLYIGLTGTMQFNELTAGRDYEVVVVKDGYKPRHLTIKADDWRDGDHPNLNIPIDVAKKKSVLERSVELEALPAKGK